VGAAAQQQAAAENVEARGPRLMLRLLTSPRWLAATLGNALGYTFQAAALGVGSLLVVQPVLITTLVFALPLSARWNHRPIRRREILWAMALCAALAVFILASDAEGGRDVVPIADWWPSMLACGLVVVAVATAATFTTGRPRALGFAIAAGTCVGFASAVTKSAVHQLGDGLPVLFGHWELYALVGIGLSGVALQQLAFQAGSLEISFPATMILDPVVSVIVGIVALHERPTATDLDWVLIGASTVVLLAGTMALGRVAAPTAAGTVAGAHR